MFQVSTAHGRNDKVYNVTSLEELPTSIQNRIFLEGYEFGEEYNKLYPKTLEEECKHDQM